MIERLAKKKFVRPSISQIKEYCELRKNGVDPEVFFNFYESKGWVVGKSPMKSWPAAVRTWEKNIKKEGEMRNPRSPEQELIQEMKHARNSIPSLSPEAKKLFYSFNVHWTVLKKRILDGEDIFAPVPKDIKSIAAGDT
jgi:hypothetical protein